jgi:hypothetical protein
MSDLLNVPGGIGLDLVPSPIRAIMTNSIQCLESKGSLESVKRLIELTQPEFIFLDSGGYTLFKKEQARERVLFDRSRPIFVPGGFNLSDIHPFLAAKKIGPTDMIQLDSPVADVSDPGERQFLFMKAAYYNIKNAKEMVRLKAIHLPNVRLFGALQVYTHDQFDTTMKHLEGVQLDGWSIPTRTLTWNEILSFIIRFRGMGYRRVHILGSYALDMILVAAFSAQHLISDVVSFDSTTWRFYADLEFFMIPIDLRAVRLKLDIQWPGSILNYRCICPHCNGLSVGEIRMMPYSEKRELLALHNYWCVDSATKAFYTLATDPKKLRAFLLNNSNRRKLIERICKAMNIIISVKDRLNEPKFNRSFATYIYDLYK